MRVRFLQDDTPFKAGEEYDVTDPEALKFESQGIAEIIEEVPVEVPEGEEW